MLEARQFRCYAIYAILLMLLSGLTYAKETLVKMDKDVADSKCGDVFVLGPSEEVRMTSNGLAPGGYCGVSIFTPTEVNNYTCNAICVTFKIATMSTCDVKVKFVGHKFRAAGDLVKEFSCHHNSKESFCWNVNSMHVDVIEGYAYAYQWKRSLYELDFDVSARCTKDNVPKSVYHFHSKEAAAAREHKTYVEGIAVGVSLACIFLIVLFIMWCYTRHQAVQSGPSSEPPRTSRAKKANFFTTFRTKLHFGHKQTDSADEPEATYRKTDTTSQARDPEAPSERSPLTTEARDTDGETYELAHETPVEETSKDGGQDSPKDGGAEESKLTPPEVVIVPGTPEPPEVASDDSSANAQPLEQA